MRRVPRLGTFVLVLVLATIMFSCATFKENTYKSLYSAGVTYDVAMKVAVDLKNEGKISEPQWVVVMTIANDYYVAYHVAVDAFETYIKTDATADKDKLAVALADMSGKLSKIVDYVNRLQGGV